MKVILDTGCFHDNIHASGEHFELLADVAPESAVEVVVPEVVVQEVVKQFRERVENASHAIQANSRDLGYLTKNFETPLLPDVDTSVEDFESNFRDRLKALNIRVLPLPTLPHQEMLNRDKENRRPFVAGRGYRDALIWESILKDLDAEPSDFIFVTANSKDFAAKVGDDQLHSDLKQDLESIEPACSGRLFATLKSFVDANIKPMLKSVDELKRALQTDSYPLFTVEQVVNEQIDRLVNVEISTHDIRVTDVDLDEPITIESADDVTDVQIERVLEMNSGRLYVEGTFACTATIEGYVFKADAYGIEEGGRIHISNWHWNEHYVAVEIRNVDLQIQFSFIFDRRKGDIESFDVARASGIEYRTT